MKKLCSIWILVLCLSLPLWSQTIESDVLDINMLHTLQKRVISADTTLIDSLTTGSLTLLLADTIVVSVENQDTIIVLSDTLEAVEDSTADADAWLLYLVARQSKLLHSNDTIWEKYPHPLCMQLMYVPAAFPSLSDTTQQNPYSIPAIRAKARRYITTHHADLYVSETGRAHV